MQCNMSFGSQPFGGFAFDNGGSSTKRLQNKKLNFTEELASRLENTQIFCRDALNLIKLKDREDTFFYCDPPYFNSDCGHYKGYSKEDFVNLLELLSRIKGKFILSSYPSYLLDEHIAKNGWQVKRIEKNLDMSKGSKKIEVLTYNF